MNIIFDFDGTICDNFDYILQLANIFLEKYGRKKVTKDDIKTKGLTTLIEESGLSTLLIIYFTLIARRDISGNILKFKLHDNLKEVITDMSKKHALGIITSNSKSNVIKFLENNKLEQDFKFIESVLGYYSKDKRLQRVIKKFDLDLNKTYYVGDEERDIKAAKKVGVKSVAVTWGFESNRILKREKPLYIVNTPKDLLNIF